MEGSILWDNVLVAEGSVLRNCIIGAGSSIGSNNILESCVIGDGITIEKDSVKAVIGAVAVIVFLLSAMTIMMKHIDDYEIKQAVQEELSGFKSEVKGECIQEMNTMLQNLK